MSGQNGKMMKVPVVVSNQPLNITQLNPHDPLAYVYVMTLI